MSTEFKGTTQWEKTDISSQTVTYLCGSHTLWSRLLDGEHIFTARPNGERPGESDGGYYTIAAALEKEGLCEQ